MNAIVLRNVTKEIKGKQIINGVTAELESGMVHGFSGANGSGKSVLFRIIAGLVIPSSGSVEVFGKNIYKPERVFAEHMGLMIDSVGLYPNLTGMQNLSYLAAIRNKVSRKDIAAVIRRVGLDPSNKAPYSKYSLGMKQRLIIAQVLMERPQLMIFDEPTNSLDEDGVALFRRIVAEETQCGSTILISSHNPEDLLALCHRTYRISNGRLS